MTRANITVTLKHETGREEKIRNCRYARYTHESTILVLAVTPDDTYREEYDAHSWDIVSVTHTEIPPSER